METVSNAILMVLVRHRKGIRYNDLHRESGREFGKRIWIKTFDKHLKLLVNSGIVERNEETRYKVFYKLRNEVYEIIPDLKWLRSFKQQLLDGWRDHRSLTLKLLKTLVHAGYMEKAEFQELDSHETLSTIPEKELETYLIMMCEDMVKNATMIAEFGFFMTLTASAQTPALAQIKMDEVIETLKTVLSETSAMFANAGEAQVLLSRLFTKVLMKFSRKMEDESQTHTRKLMKIARRLGLPIKNAGNL